MATIKARLDRLQAALKQSYDFRPWVMVTIDGERIWISEGNGERELTPDELHELEKTHRVIVVQYAENWREYD